MGTKKKKPKEKIELDKEKTGKKAEDCSIFVEDMIIAGEEEGEQVSEALAKKRKKKSKKK